MVLCWPGSRLLWKLGCSASFCCFFLQRNHEILLTGVLRYWSVWKTYNLAGAAVSSNPCRACCVVKFKVRIPALPWVSRALAQTASALAVALVALLLAFSRKGTSCQTQTASSLCQQIETASSAVQGLRALQELCDKCKKGKDNYGSDPCSSLPQPTLEEVFSKGRSRFSALEQELVEISQKIIATLQEVGGQHREENECWELCS